MIASLKDPKNAGSWIIAGLALAIGGYFLWMKFESAGKIVGFIGSCVVLFTLFRVAITKTLYGVIIVAAVVAYGVWYTKSRTVGEMEPQSKIYEHEPWKVYTTSRKVPKYAESGMSQTLQAAVFAPAFMFENMICFGAWRSTTTEKQNLEYKPSKM